MKVNKVTGRAEHPDRRMKTCRLYHLCGIYVLAKQNSSYNLFLSYNIGFTTPM